MRGGILVGEQSRFGYSGYIGNGPNLEGEDGEIHGIDTDGSLTKSDEELLKSVTEGFQSPGSMLAMPPNGGNPELTVEDAKAVISYLRTHFGESD